MNILWIPHTHWDSKTYRRDIHLINHLKRKNKISVITWEGKVSNSFPGNIISIVRTLKFFIYEKEKIKFYHIPKLFGIGNPWKFPFTVIMKINELIFNYYLNKITTQEKTDIIIVGPNAYLIGYPKVKNIPIIFDFLDCSDWTHINPWALMEKKYFLISKGVLCVSNYAFRIATKYNKNAILLPNGVELNRFYKKNKEEAKKLLGFQGKKVVSLIGPTFSSDDYFMTAIINILNQRKEVVFILIGINERITILKKRYLHPRLIYIDHVPYSKISDYFIATDIGLYPGDDNPWFHGALPLKVFEYTASQCWVLVSPELYSIKSLNLKNIMFSKNNTEDFYKKLISLLDAGKPKIDYKKLMNYSWYRISKKLEKYLIYILKYKF